MNRLLALAALIVFAALAAGSSAANDPPGRDPCGHGATGKPCKPDPQPDRGKDCEDHGKHGDGNEDHCRATVPPPPNPPPASPPPTRPPTSPPSVTPPASTPPASTPPASTPPAAAPPPASTKPTTAKAPAVKTSSKVKLPTGNFKKDKCVKIKKGALYSCKIGNKRVIVVPGSG